MVSSINSNYLYNLASLLGTQSAYSNQNTTLQYPNTSSSTYTNNSTSSYLSSQQIMTYFMQMMMQILMSLFSRMTQQTNTTVTTPTTYSNWNDIACTYSGPDSFF